MMDDFGRDLGRALVVIGVVGSVVLCCAGLGLGALLGGWLL